MIMLIVNCSSLSPSPTWGRDRQEPRGPPNLHGRTSKLIESRLHALAISAYTC